tara:strand:- start:57 stop:743 length:687 start_codon:yes stop_codon:yes gene_type:complete
MRDKYLYFGLNAAATQAFDNVDCSGAQTFQLTTGGFQNPIPTGVNFLTNGGAKVTVTAHANHSFGSAYGSPAAGVEVDITAACTIHATNGTITVNTVATDAVNGFTGDASTAANNDFDVTQLKPYDDGDGFLYNSKYLRGVHYQTATTTELHFQGKTGDFGATHDVDTITVTHGSAKFKEFAQELTDVIADDNKVKGMVVVRDDIRDINLTVENASGIASVAQTATAS